MNTNCLANINLMIDNYKLLESGEDGDIIHLMHKDNSILIISVACGICGYTLEYLAPSKVTNIIDKWLEITKHRKDATGEENTLYFIAGGTEYNTDYNLYANPKRLEFLHFAKEYLENE